jgi:DNA invertase Pin-like site-specific DNA recombinase
LSKTSIKLPLLTPRQLVLFRLTLLLSLTVDCDYIYSCRRRPTNELRSMGRVSTDDGRQDATNQLIELREFADPSGWEIVHEYVDKASGKTANRPQFRRMFEDAAKRRFDLVLFWALNRLSREGVSETLNHLNKLTAYGVDWRSYQESYLNSCGPFKDVVISLMATPAKQERLRISDRTKAGLNRARRQGKVLGRPRVAVDVGKVRELRAPGWG